jgi:osmotically-inducible protein OsmY
MKLIVPLVTILLLTSTLSLTACSQVEQQSSEETTSSPSEVAETISAFRVGLNGEYDQSGLAKRVAKALAEDSELAGISTIYVAQTESTIVLKGTVPNQTVLDKMVSVAQSVNGITDIEISQVEVRAP